MFNIVKTKLSNIYAHKRGTNAQSVYTHTSLYKT